ncbi:hypothetical protein DM01DRAFT_1383890, partial [Hesseltinella vesiculosa]
MLIVNEDRTSMTSPFCRSRIVQPKKSNGRTNNGMSMCLNKSCPTVKLGVNTFGRDTLAVTSLTFAVLGSSLTMKHPSKDSHLFFFFTTPLALRYEGVWFPCKCDNSLCIRTKRHCAHVAVPRGNPTFWKMVLVFLPDKYQS